MLFLFLTINNEWLTRDPFREYEIKKEETTRSFLTKDEIRLLMADKKRGIALVSMDDLNVPDALFRMAKEAEDDADPEA